VGRTYPVAVIADIRVYGPQAWLPVQKSGHEQNECDDWRIHSDLRYHRQSNAG
jgi:hypothetical protein